LLPAGNSATASGALGINITSRPTIIQYDHVDIDTKQYEAVSQICNYKNQNFAA